MDIDKFIEFAKQNGMKVEYNKNQGGLMLNNEDLFIDTKKVENGNWEVFVKHIPTGINWSCLNSKIQKENLDFCKEYINDMLLFYKFCKKEKYTGIMIC